MTESGVLHTVLLCGGDLMFSAKVREALSGREVLLRVARTVDEAEKALSGSVQQCIVDLDSPRLDPYLIIRLARRKSSHCTVLAFFSHVQPKRGEDALAAGAQVALPRSQFFKELGSLLFPGKS